MLLGFGRASELTSPRRALALVLLVLGVLAGALPNAKSRAQAAAPRGLAVASESARATQEAMALLAATKDPGNAVDAAVAAALVAGVTHPSSSGIGGGGFVNYWDQASGRSVILDFREVAPAELDAAAFERRPFADDARGLSVGVPGEVAGLYELHRRFGHLSWQRVVSVAERVADRGFSVSRHMQGVLSSNGEALARDPGLDSLWLSGGRPPVLGAWIKNPRLAKTLSAIGEQGPDAFYKGTIAAEIVATVRGHGSKMTLADLEEYRVRERAPLRFEFAGATIYTMPPPSAGGYMLAQTAALFSSEELAGLGRNSSAYVHALGEAFRAAIADRMRYFGDPDQIEVDLGMLLSKSRMERRRRSIALDRTHALPRFGLEEHGTHHLVVRDSAGNVVSLTTTVNTGFGADLMTPRSGIVLNDELDDFTKNTWVERFGLTASPNRARPGTRPVSSMTPTVVVRDGHVILAAGGSGGMHIATDVAQSVLGQLSLGGTARSVVAAPRFQIPVFGATLRVREDVGIDFIRDLQSRGEVVDTYQTTFTAVQMLSVMGGIVTAAADPQKHGLALVR